MPDVEPPSLCDYPSGPPAGYTPFTPTMELEPCLTNLPSHPHPLAPYPRHPHSVPPFPGLQGVPYPVLPRCNSGALLTNLGLRYCSSNNVASSRQGPQRMGPGGLGPGPFLHTGAGPAGGRLYRSMESLNWSGGPDPALCGLNGAPYGSVDSEVIFRCTATNHWYDGPPEGGLYGMVPNHEGLAFYPRRGLARKDLPLFPQWLFPGADEWDARKGLRDKLRLQSARSAAEPVKPLRPQVTPGATPPALGSHEGHGNPGSGLAGSRPLSARRVTSPEDIKQEVLRRLQLRRQNSSPNLASAPQSPKVLHPAWFTTDSLAANGTAPSPAAQRRRPPMERLHIPTFEEFKRMRRASEGGGGGSDAGGPADAVGGPSLSPSGGKAEDGGDRTDKAQAGDKPGEGGAASSPARCRAASASSPICTGPLPRSPLQPLASSAPERGSVVGLRLGVGEGRPRRSSLDPAGTVAFPPRRESAEGPSSCCPALLLDGTDLSSYGAKIYRMKDGLIGSALDLIMKSCSAEISAAEAPARLSADQDGGRDITAPLPLACHSPLVAMATPPSRARGVEACDEPPAGGGGGGGGGGEGGGEGEGEEEEDEEEQAECQHSGLGCRRSSSDAAYEPAESVRAQRECRLRPHYSDPMPADAAKRKQLEMKIAAAARLHSQRRDRDRDRDSAPAAVRVRSEPRGEKRLGVIRVGQHRWSTVSSLSVDSGVVGLSDERIDDADDGHEARRFRRSGGTEVERADSGIGPCLARGWKRPSASLRAWEAQRPCPDCGQRDGSAGGERSEAMCERCAKLRTERKEAILEFLNTETSYGEDLRIIRAEFYSPMQHAGLLTAEQLQVVFSNVQELIDVNERFSEHLQDSIDQALDQGDEDLLTVCIGEIFLEFVNMLPAFQTYCLQQSMSVNMLNSLEKEKELLRIFLDVSQNDNTALRRMNLRSFLMAPLQRVTKYPLLLSRISKATTECHPDHGRLREAKSRVESHLEHINMKTKQEGLGGGGGGGVTWSLRSFRRDSRKSREVANLEMREVSLKTVGWARESTRFVMEGPLQLAQPADGQWVKKGPKGLKFQNVQSLLMVRTQRPGEGSDAAAVVTKGDLQPSPVDTGGVDSIRDGVLVLIKDKSSGKFTVLREPIRLSNCVVSSDPDCDDTFEVLDIRKESFVFRASDKSRTQQWFRQIKRHARDLGPWRKRRNALPNIMINTTQIRS